MWIWGDLINFLINFFLFSAVLCVCKWSKWSVLFNAFKFAEAGDFAHFTASIPLAQHIVV